MTAAEEQIQLQCLKRLTQQRETAAMAILDTAREAMAAAQQALDTQQQVIDELQSHLNALIDWRESSAAPGADELVMLGNRRRWLTYDLEKEQYYFGVAQNDWRDARRKMNIARRTWLACRGRLDALDSRRTVLEQTLARQADRYDSQALDDRINLELEFHG